ncbi:predicted protein [Naegleria gruberi]|uniref:Predicted protein n=1 Tax=Naegleria gruberi TaxID=5762 RepID=D2UYY9_NAEGR|nr:uncharacterized protein NAEGRDRAFT_61752 [Naegleria gruberi]EFC50055.1 predicted protein [Naegleria gruberi]|eukprot:XP_002682799.1 predicted protein [Naegleria gruberi strain NEG-M]
MQRNPQYQSDRDKKYHHLVSNAFDFETSLISLPTISANSCKYSTSFLQKNTVEKLKEIGKKEHIKLSKLTKDEIIQKIQFICNSTNVKSLQLHALHSFDQNQFNATSAIHHDHYRRTFTLVDIQDKYHYKARYAYIITEWRTKLMISLLNDFFYNLFAIMNETVRIKYSDFRKLLAETFLSMGKKLRAKK